VEGKFSAERERELAAPRSMGEERRKTPGSVYYEVWGRGFGQEGAGRVSEVFNVVREAPRQAINLMYVVDAKKGKPLHGCAVDSAGAGCIDEAG